MRLSKAVDGFLTVRLGEDLSPTTGRLYRLGLDKLVDYLHDPEVEKITGRLATVV